MIIHVLGHLREGIPEALAPLRPGIEGWAGICLRFLRHLLTLPLTVLLHWLLWVTAALALARAGLAVHFGEELTTLIVSFPTPCLQIRTIRDTLTHESSQHGPATVVELRSLGHYANVVVLTAVRFGSFDGEAAILLGPILTFYLEGTAAAHLWHLNAVLVCYVWRRLILPVDVEVAFVNECVHQGTA